MAGDFCLSSQPGDAAVNLQAERHFGYPVIGQISRDRQVNHDAAGRYDWRRFAFCFTFALLHRLFEQLRVEVQTDKQPHARSAGC